MLSRQQRLAGTFLLRQPLRVRLSLCVALLVLMLYRELPLPWNTHSFGMEQVNISFLETDQNVLVYIKRLDRKNVLFTDLCKPQLVITGNRWTESQRHAVLLIF